MDIKNVTANTSYNHYAKDNVSLKKQETSTEKPSVKSTPPNRDTFEKSATYKADLDQVYKMKQNLSSNINAFEKMVGSLFKEQGLKYNSSMGIKKNLENLISSGGVSEADRLAAQDAISENGDWGVEKTAERILNFAKALSGGDSAKISTLKNAVMKGFAEAEKAWGGKLPDICGKTYDRIMEGFDQWEKQAGANE